jgi:aldehyde:ferredoxin oxidoreductase
VDPKAEIFQHGPAAEKGVLFSSLLSMSNRHNGRTGMGLVMASKNLKAVVARGRKRVALADQKALTALNKTGPKILPDNPDMPGLAAEGTATVVVFQNTIGSLPTRNYNEGQFESCEDISGTRMVETILKERDTCYACVVRCKRVVEIKEGAYRADPKYGGPEYETLGTFGSYCGINDLAAVAQANQICNEYGVDTIACGATIAFAIECFEKGIGCDRKSGRSAGRSAESGIRARRPDLGQRCRRVSHHGQRCRGSGTYAPSQTLSGFDLRGQPIWRGSPVL